MILLELEILKVLNRNRTKRERDTDSEKKGNGEPRQIIYTSCTYL
jgi:hypothetical protein